MPSLRFYKRIRLLPGVYLNIAKGGFSISLGRRGLAITFGRFGIRFTLGIPGTGFSITEQVNYDRAKTQKHKKGLPCSSDDELSKFLRTTGEGEQDGKKEEK